MNKREMSSECEPKNALNAQIRVMKRDLHVILRFAEMVSMLVAKEFGPAILTDVNVCIPKIRYGINKLSG